MSERWLVTGASGQLGGHLLRALEREAPTASVLAVTRGREIATCAPIAAVDFTELAALRATTREFRPTHVLHVGAMTAVADCFADPERARAINADATRVLAATAAECGARFVFSSTDMVFDGGAAPYTENDEPKPTTVYGRTKREAECEVLALPRSLVVRIPLLYGRACTARPTTFANQIAALRRGEPLRLFTDEFRTPVWLRDAAGALLTLARSDLSGVIHMAGPERLSRFDMGVRFAKLLGIASPRLDPVSRLSIQPTEPRPADLSLDAAQFEKLFPQSAPGPIRRAALDD